VLLLSGLEPKLVIRDVCLEPESRLRSDVT
jgi:hypothetical protein